MLAELQQLHEKIVDLIGQLATLCEDRHCDIIKVSEVRLELTRASRARSAFLNAVVYPKVLRAASGDKKIALEKLKSDGLLMLVRSGDHIRHWTSREIAEDWPGYCRASAAARQTMLDRVALEAELLYPLLKRDAHGRQPTARS